MSDTDNTTPETDEPTDAAQAEVIEEEDVEDMEYPDAAIAVELVRATAEDLDRAIHAAATRGGSVDKTEVDRQTSRLQARSLHALVELAAAGAFTPPVATIESVYNYAAVPTSEDGGPDTAESEAPATVPEAEDDTPAEDTTAKKGKR